jgi:heptosyltransferase-2
VTRSYGKIDRIVVRGTNWVGDSVMTVPALRALRQLLPKAHLTVATRSLAKGLFDDADFIDDLLICEGSLWAQVRQWRQGRFDLAVLFQNAFEPALIARLAGVPLRVGYATQGRGWLLTNSVSLPEWRDSHHESLYYLNLIAEVDRLLNGSSSILERNPVFDLKVANNRRAEAQVFLKAAGINLEFPVIALCPGSINSRAKRWPADRYALLGDRLIKDLGAQILVIGSADEARVSEEVRSHMQHPPLILTGKTDLGLAIGVLSLVDLLVTNDTGPAHIAAALNRPTLAIFGPTNPLTTRPLSGSAQVLRHPPDCAPCMLRDCPIDHRCMTAISTEEVFTLAVKMLTERATLAALQIVATPPGETSATPGTGGSQDNHLEPESNHWEAHDKLKSVGRLQ